MCQPHLTFLKCFFSGWINQDPWQMIFSSALGSNGANEHSLPDRWEVVVFGERFPIAINIPRR
jgi:hypothetical protein